MRASKRPVRPVAPRAHGRHARGAASSPGTRVQTDRHCASPCTSKRLRGWFLLQKLPKIASPHARDTYCRNNRNATIGQRSPNRNSRLCG
ncbi:outer membrane porin domain protein [Burkholderia mallei]|nr:outer membrane porin domain protein [Burkholderia mallei]KOT08498.1 outer membrane porin domain protein [Burkholderia mallei]